MSNSNQNLREWNREDTAWMLTLFGTAVGAGILFLPIKAGLAGIYSLILVTVIIGPMVYWAHRGFSRVCLTQTDPNGDITDAVTEYFGPRGGALITLLYFLAIYPIVMIYGVGLTNTLTDVAVNQLGLEEPNRLILSGVIVVSLTLIMATSHKVVTRITEAIVFPLIAVLFLFSLYLIPQWSLNQFAVIPSASDFLIAACLTIPILVFAFNHSPAVSTFSGDYRRSEGDAEAEPLASRTLKRTAGMLTVFIMFFVFSCVLTLSPADLESVRDRNLSIMAAFAEREQSVVITWVAQGIALIAITSSFFGHYMGTAEGLKGLVVKGLRRGDPDKEVNHKAVNIFVALFIILTVWAVAYKDPNIMGLIDALVAPVLAFILFIMPVYAIRKVPALAKYKSATDYFIATMGIITIIIATYWVYEAIS
jgi:serine transporter